MSPTKRKKSPAKKKKEAPAVETNDENVPTPSPPSDISPIASHTRSSDRKKTKDDGTPLSPTNKSAATLTKKSKKTPRKSEEGSTKKKKDSTSKKKKKTPKKQKEDREENERQSEDVTAGTPDAAHDEDISTPASSCKKKPKRRKSVSATGSETKKDDKEEDRATSSTSTDATHDEGISNPASSSKKKAKRRKSDSITGSEKKKDDGEEELATPSTSTDAAHDKGISNPDSSSQNKSKRKKSDSATGSETKKKDGEEELHKLSTSTDAAHDEGISTPDSSSKNKSKRRKRDSTPGSETKRARTEKNESPRKKQKKRKVDEVEQQKEAADTKHNDDSSSDEEDMDKENAVVVVPKKPRPPALNVMVHRVRCLSYMPKPIVCMASLSFKENSFLAVARNDGSVELKCPMEKFRTMTTIAGQSPRPVHVMAWITSNEASFPSCIGGSVDGTLFVLDWKHAQVTSVIGSGGGGVLSLASLQHSNVVAAGCEDGSIRIHQLEDEKLQLVSTIATGGAAVLSLAWSQITTESTVLFAGLADGTIRRYDSTLKNDQWQWKSSWRITVESLGRSIPTRVWSLLSLQGGATVVSGDSLGHVQFWDGKTGTLIQSCDQSDAKADVLCLTATENDKVVFGSGVDSRIVCIERSSTGWLLTNAQRPHTHDVKAMAICKTDSGKDMLCSGGIDTKLCVYPTTGKDFRKQRPKIMYPWPAVTPIAVANQARLLTLKRQDRIDFFPLVKQNAQKQQLDHDLISTLEIKSTCNLSCSDISSDGTLLAVSNAVEGLMLFQLRRETNPPAVIPTKVKLPSYCKSPSVALKFVSNNRLVCASASGPIVVLGLTISEGDVQMEALHTFSQDQQEQQALFPIHALHVSHDGAWLVSCQNGSQGGAIHVYSIAGDAYKHWWTLPKLEVSSTSVGFLLSNELAVSCVNSGFYIFNVQQKKLSLWSETVGFPVTPSLPQELANRNDYPVRFGFNKATPKKVLMGSFGAFCAIDLDKPMSKHCRIFPETHVRGGNGRKRSLQGTKKSIQDTGKKAKEEEVDNCTICLRYNSMLYLDFIEENELLVVEQPWLSVVASFPEALERKVYGS